MFLVGGGIVVHSIPPLHHWAEAWHGLAATAVNAGVGLGAGAAVVAILAGFRRVARHLSGT
jgi:predicted DNA repair protein MutK